MAISKADIAPFLSSQKLPSADVPDSTLITTGNIIYSRLNAAGYDTTKWNTTAQTPPVVRTIHAMYAAGTYYNTVFSELSGDRNSYGSRLQSQALSMLQLIVDGAMSLGDKFDLPSAAPDAGLMLSDPVFTIGRVF